MKINSTIHILIVEDNSGDILLTKEALKDADFPLELMIARDGEEALRMLLEGDGLKPDLILLDLNLPKKSGTEVLTQIKNHPELKRTPVIIWSTSRSETDVKMCYDLQANCFINKPLEYEAFTNMIRSLLEFWVRHPVYPPWGGGR